MEENTPQESKFPDRVCPECHKTFTPKVEHQKYDTPRCRTSAGVRRHWERKLGQATRG